MVSRAASPIYRRFGWPPAYNEPSEEAPHLPAAPETARHRGATFFIYGPALPVTILTLGTKGGEEADVVERAFVASEERVGQFTTSPIGSRLQDADERDEGVEIDGLDEVVVEARLAALLAGLLLAVARDAR